MIFQLLLIWFLLVWFFLYICIKLLEMRKFIGWTLAIIITLGLAFYQRMTGPTYPVIGKINYLGKDVKYSLPRSWAKEDGAVIGLNIADTMAHGIVMFKRFRSDDEWQTQKLTVKNGKITMQLPPLPPAGKMMYQIWLFENGKKIPLSEDPVILRYRGDVPAVILIPHIIFMFLSMFLSVAAGLFFFRRRMNLQALAGLATLTLFIGGAILGPLVQKYAFDAYWTGWPFGTDLTDNKTAISLLFWVVAFIIIRRNPRRRGWVLAAALVQLAVYLIPHSMFGSEIDFTKHVH